MRRTKEVARLLTLNSRSSPWLRHSVTSVPKEHYINQKGKILKIYIKEPTYRPKEYWLERKDSLVFSELKKENIQWLFQFATAILKSGNNESIPFYNSQKDYTTPGISAFRVYNTCEDDFLQVQVRRIPFYTGLYQLDYFESSDNKYLEPEMVLICDVSEPKKTSVDIVYSTEVSEISKDYAEKIATTFRDILVYLRIWDYSEKSKHCSIAPLFPFEAIPSVAP